METLHFTRKEMSSLLQALSQPDWGMSPIAVVQEMWKARHPKEVERGRSMAAFISTSLPPIIEKMIKSGMNPAFSLHDIVSLGAQIEYTHFSVTSVQNWVKRDFKCQIGLAELGKKYSVQQVAMFFMIEDLRSTLDYEAIRNFLHIVFPSYMKGKEERGRTERTEDETVEKEVTPLEFYSVYAGLFEDLDNCYRNHEGTSPDLVHKWDSLIHEVAHEYAVTQPGMSDNRRETLQNAIHVALISVHTSCFQSLSRRYANGMVFLHNL